MAFHVDMLTYYTCETVAIIKETLLLTVHAVEGETRGGEARVTRSGNPNRNTGLPVIPVKLRVLRRVCVGSARAAPDDFKARSIHAHRGAEQSWYHVDPCCGVRTLDPHHCALLRPGTSRYIVYMLALETRNMYKTVLRTSPDSQVHNAPSPPAVHQLHCVYFRMHPPLENSISSSQMQQVLQSPG